MVKANLSGMSVEALTDLRERVEGLLSERHAELQADIGQLIGHEAAKGSMGAVACHCRGSRRSSRKSNIRACP